MHSRVNPSTDDKPGSTDRLDELRVGQTESISRTITAEDVAAFAKLSGDFNALHVDDEFAARTEYQSRVVHGFLHASLLSTLIGMKLPGRGALYVGQTIEFSAPVFIGDRLVATATIESIDRDMRLVVLQTEILNQHGKRVLRGKAKARVLRIAAPPELAASQDLSSPSPLLAGKVALVTGASRGIGHATAKLLAAHGAVVWANYNRSEAAARALQAEITGAGGRCEVVRADVTVGSAASAMVEEILRAGPLDILVNNAAPRPVAAPFDKVEWSDMSAAFDAIVGSAFCVTRAALPSLKRNHGTIVNVLSVAALQRTAHGWLPYAAAKAALHAMSKNLAQELGPSGVTVNMVSPSMVDTDLASSVPDRARQAIIGRTPLRRLATVDDVAGAILMLVSPFARFLTGENLLVAGGDVMV
ncbi:MAG: SDR family oxidoreductase [Hyphomicrobiaceae bacterium]|nr:MAG: SDR family oxidoreductase [Hyphomicrobiaceae bacterium]